MSTAGRAWFEKLVTKNNHTTDSSESYTRRLRRSFHRKRKMTTSCTSPPTTTQIGHNPLLSVVYDTDSIPNYFPLRSLETQHTCEMSLGRFSSDSGVEVTMRETAAAAAATVCGVDGARRGGGAPPCCRGAPRGIAMGTSCPCRGAVKPSEKPQQQWSRQNQENETSNQLYKMGTESRNKALERSIPSC